MHPHSVVYFAISQFPKHAGIELAFVSWISTRLLQTNQRPTRPKTIRAPYHLYAVFLVVATAHQIVCTVRNLERFAEQCSPLGSNQRLKVSRYPVFMLSTSKKERVPRTRIRSRHSTTNHTLVWAIMRADYEFSLHHTGSGWQKLLSWRILET